MQVVGCGGWWGLRRALEGQAAKQADPQCLLPCPFMRRISLPPLLEFGLQPGIFGIILHAEKE
ncbi:hypothetical protein AA15237_2164 [Komagataeibacter xylinus NBRC 15237]|nr:hypothetical protein AA15237_2164 [Komagataeibacter xylinus NBRC 15237]